MPCLKDEGGVRGQHRHRGKKYFFETAKNPVGKKKNEEKGSWKDRLPVRRVRRGRTGACRWHENREEVGVGVQAVPVVKLEKKKWQRGSVCIRRPLKEGQGK